MNEPVLPAIPVEPAGPDYKDRSTGLLVFGILTIGLGGFAALFALLTLAGQVARPASAAVNPSAVLSIVAAYGVIAVALIWLGIGSIMARRWARALLLIFSWSWLIMGIFISIGMIWFMPKMLANAQAAHTTGQPVPPGAMAVAMVFMGVFATFFFIVLPAVWVFFYRSRHVKATCEVRDPVARWTDRCPLPVLGLSLWLLISVPMMALMPFIGHGTMPLFGIFLSGVPGSLCYLAMAGLWCYAAWLVYNVKPAGWWLVLIGMILFTASGVITYSRHDILEIYQQMGYPQAQIDQIQKTGMFAGNTLVWTSLVSVVPLLGYMLFVKKYFRKTF